MKSMFLASSFVGVTDLFVEFTEEKCKDKTITFIPTASTPEDVNYYVAAGKEALEKLGLTVDELDISTATKEEIEGKLRGNDYIYVSGGNSFFLLQELKRTGTDKLIVELINAGKIYVGESAGAVVLANDIEYVKAMDDASAAPDLESFSGLGVVEFYPVPHYTDFPYQEEAENIIANHDHHLPLRPFSNNQAIVVTGDEFDVLDA